MSEKEMACPECHYAWYKYYEETDISEVVIDETHNYEDAPLYVATEIPVVVKTPRGYLCILCLYEWKEDGIPVDRETIEKSVASFRTHGRASYDKIHSSTPIAKDV